MRLDDVTARALDWVGWRLSEFRLATPTAVDRVKRLGELALAASALPQEHGRALLAWVWRELDGGEAIAALIRSAPTIACAYLPLRRAGLRSRAVELALADPTCRQGAGAWHPFVRYAVGVALAAVGVSPPWNQQALLPRLSVIRSSAPDTPVLCAGVMAQAIMWQTDQGRAPYGLDPEERARLAKVLDPWCSRLARDGEIGALLQMIVAARCARLAMPANAWGTVRAAQRGDGAIPARRGAGGSFEDLCQATLVALFAGGLATRDLPATDRFTTLVE
jgi:hypothetical protein